MLDGGNTGRRTVALPFVTEGGRPFSSQPGRGSAVYTGIFDEGKTAGR